MFKSVQSEGHHSGTPANFIRFYGCNLQCKFGEYSCDEPLHTQQTAIEETSLEEILNFCNGIKHVVITGGEPSINDLKYLIKMLRKAGHYVQVETNGLNYQNIKNANWITYSPKTTWDENASEMQGNFHELKLLASEEFPPDVEKWATVKNKYVQPIADGDKLDFFNTKWCYRFVISNPTWKLSLQSHKMAGER